MLLIIASHAYAAVVSAELWFDPPARLDANVRASASHALLDLAPLGHTSLNWSISWQAAHASFTEGEGRDLNGAYHGEFRQWTQVMGAGNLTNATCLQPCILLVIPRTDGLVELTGSVAGPLAERGRETRHEIHLGAGTPKFESTVPKPWFGFTTSPAVGDALMVSGAEIDISGGVQVILWGVQATVQTDANDEVWWTGHDVSRPVAAIPIDEVRWRYVILELEDVAFHSPTAPVARLDAPAFSVASHGTWSAPEVYGWIAIDGLRTRLEGESLRMDAEWQVDIRRSDAGQGAGPTERRLTSRTEISAAGTATSVTIGGHAFLRPEILLDRQAASILVILTVGLLAAKPSLLFLYSRLDPAHLLDHPTRLRLHEHIQRHPGQHISAIGRELNIGRVLLQHHLRLLESHRFVSSRGHGKLVVYFVPEDVPSGAILARSIALKDGTRQCILTALHGAGGSLSQRDLVEVTGISQRLVSYHLIRLERVGAVVSEGTRPRRFRPRRDCPPAEADRNVEGKKAAGSW